MEHLIVNMGERRWLWSEALFLSGVQKIGTTGGPQDEATLIRQIKLATLEQKGIPLEKMHVILQPINERSLNPQLHHEKRVENETCDGIWSVLWIQWLPEIGKREKLRGKNLRNRLNTVVNKNRNYLITVSIDVPVDVTLLKKRWGTSTESPPIDNDKFAMKAMFQR
mmetsp:Transcript_47438/g.60924  ORF Transcript_47438/g.60924 Transcript_47438/m.60924 type:complete len:167 (-) Transcript_47438:420-920(-)